MPLSSPQNLAEIDPNLPYPVSVVARCVGLSKDTIRTRIREGKIAVCPRDGGKFRVMGSEIYRLNGVEVGKTQPKQESLSARAKRARAAMATITATMGGGR